MRTEILGPSKQKVLLVQNPTFNWPTKRHVGSGPGGKLTYAEFMTDLEQRFGVRDNVVDITLKAPGSDGVGKPSILDASDQLIEKRWLGLLPVKFITPDEKTIDNYAKFVSLVDQKFHDIRNTYGDQPEWKAFLDEKHERSTKLIAEINAIRIQETEEWIKQQMVTPVRDDKKKKDLFGLALKEEDLVTEHVRTNVPGQTGTYERVRIADTWAANRRNTDFRAALAVAGIKSGRDLVKWAENLGKPGNIGPNSPANVGHFQSTQAWKSVQRRALASPGGSGSCT
ncbi:unnamed protein product [Fusarium graminearum]|nr:unnamed protein product [Fusarium graminearum]